MSNNSSPGFRIFCLSASTLSLPQGWQPRQLRMLPRHTAEELRSRQRHEVFGPLLSQAPCAKCSWCGKVSFHKQWAFRSQSLDPYPLYSMIEQRPMQQLHNLSKRCVRASEESSLFLESCNIVPLVLLLRSFGCPLPAEHAERLQNRPCLDMRAMRVEESVRSSIVALCESVRLLVVVWSCLVHLCGRNAYL